MAVENPSKPAPTVPKPTAPQNNPPQKPSPAPGYTTHGDNSANVETFIVDIQKRSGK